MLSTAWSSSCVPPFRASEEEPPRLDATLQKCSLLSSERGTQPRPVWFGSLLANFRERRKGEVRSAPSPGPEGLTYEGHNTCRYYQCLMYEQALGFDTLHKNPSRIGPGPADFRENPILRTSV